MKLTKFERKRLEIVAKHQQELADLVDAERKERQKLIEPVIDKIAKVAAEEARKILEKNPEILEDYTFKKREAGKALAESLQVLFDEKSEEEKAEVQSEPKPAVGSNHGSEAATTLSTQTESDQE